MTMLYSPTVRITVSVGSEDNTLTQENVVTLNGAENMARSELIDRVLQAVSAGVDRIDADARLAAMDDE